VALWQQGYRLYDQDVPKYPLVYIEWDDACSDPNWTEISSIAKISILKCHTTAYLVGENRKQIVVSTTIGANDECIDPLAIPKKCITKRVILKDI